ncbi:MAG: multidrug efflux SMR transporter [Candidatus Methanomethylophilaceae archaeon]|nr:multidrug efflux SMR transporter [Candidatus Methanomethylophilaceae archaeon]
MNRTWGVVLIGGVFEMVWASTMKLSNGFSDLLFTILTGIFIVVSVLFLNYGLKAGLPTGICYSVWVGIGAVCSTIVSVFYFGEPMTMVGVLFLGVLIAGIVGLNFLEGGSEKEDAS